jgi:hypothetical protein
MDKHIGQIGEVIGIVKDTAIITFNGVTWHYPKDQAIEHLANKHINDNINPSHYKKLPKQTIERIQDNLTPEEFKGYLKGNIFKYIDRYENKNGVEDLKKAQWYLEKLISIND